MMQSDRGNGGGGEEMRQNQRLKPLQGDQQQQQRPSQPQKCPRCESFNTKFCYYNNYSLSQPRFFCKTCRRYWTNGGTQRNVPVGGGCRKGKRTKMTSSGDEKSSSQPNQPHPPQNFTAPQTMVITNSAIGASPAVMRTKDSVVPSTRSYHPGDGFMSSLEAIQFLQPPPPPFNLPVSLGDGGEGASSYLNLLQGFHINDNEPSFGSNQQINQQRQFYQMSKDRDKSTSGFKYPSDEQKNLVLRSNRPAASSFYQHNWQQNLINNTDPNLSDTTMWSTGSSSTGGNSETTAGNIPGYGAPP